MCDPKYAGLPGIDRSQPDVYETSDLPEDDQQAVNQFATDENSESVERLEMSPNQAFQQFKGKRVDTAFVDFSDQISGRRKTGYHIPRSEYEILGEACDVKETPEQRFQRLQHEMRELAEDLNAVKETAKTEESGNLIALTNQVQYLSQQMNELLLDRQLGGADVNLADPQGALQKRLLTELAGFKSAGPKPSLAATGDKTKAAVSAPASAADDGHVTYQLFFRPEQAKFNNTARIAELEQRLERLEAVLGHNSEKITALNADLATKSLLTAVSTLASRTKLLDASQLDQVDARLIALQQHLSQVAEKKEAVEQTGKISRVNELYELVKKWDSVADEVPHIVDRLSDLQQLHEHALNFSQTLTHLEATQSQVDAHLKSHSALLKQVQSTIDENMAAVQANCTSLGNRLNALKK